MEDKTTIGKGCAGGCMWVIIIAMVIGVFFSTASVIDANTLLILAAVVGIALILFAGSALSWFFTWIKDLFR